MHEMAIAQSIVEIVEEHARRDGFARARTVHLAIGLLSTVEPRALEFGFEVAARGTASEGATLVIERPAGSARCVDCDALIEVAAHGEPCPACGGYRWLVVGGDEMRLIDLEVE